MNLWLLIINEILFHEASALATSYHYIFGLSVAGPASLAPRLRSHAKRETTRRLNDEE